MAKYFEGHTCGMCGNADGDRSNDLAMRQGQTASNDAEFGNSWVIPGRDEK